MSLQLTIGANVQPAIDGVNSVTKVLQDFASKGKLSIEVVENSMQDLKTAIKTSSDPAVVNKLKSAYAELSSTLKKLKIEGGLEQQLGGVSRATKLAHNDIGQLVGSLESFSRGSSGAVDGVSNLIFTFEKLKGVTGSTSGAIGSIAEAFLSPAGLVLALGAGIPLIIEAAEKFGEMSDGSRQAKQELDSLTESLKRNKVLLEGYNDDLDQASVTRKLKIDLETPSGTGRTLAELKSDLDAAHTKISGITPALKEWQSELDGLQKKNDLLTQSIKEQHAELSKEGKVLFEGNEKKIDQLKKQIDDFKKQEEKANADITNIPIRIKVIEGDQAAEDVKKVLAKANQEAKKAAAERERLAKEEAARLKSLFTVFAAPDKIDVPSLKNTQVFFDALKADINKGIKPVDIQIPVNVQLHLDKRGDALKEAQRHLDDLNKIVHDGLSEIGASFAQGLGSILAGGDISSAFVGIFKSIGGALQSLGKAMIAHAIAIQAFRKAFTNPIAEAAAGFGLIIAGSLLQTALSKSTKFERGGLVFGPTLGLVGEGSGTNRSNPEVIAPLDKLKGMLGGLALNGSGGWQVAGILKGSDIVLSVNRTNRTQGRSF